MYVKSDILYHLDFLYSRLSMINFVSLNVNFLQIRHFELWVRRKI